MITDKSLLAFYANIVSLAYELKSHEVPGSPPKVCAQIDNSTGLKAMAYWDAASWQLLVSIAGTDPFGSWDFAKDVGDDIALALTGKNEQFEVAKDWISMLLRDLDMAGTAPATITFAGHSLGGFIAQNLSNHFGIARPAEAILFNSAGIDPSLSGLGDATFATSTIVCSDPRTWSSATGFVHATGDLDPVKMLFTWGGADRGIGLDGHGIEDLVVALESDAVRLVDAAGLEDLMLQSLLDEETTVAAFEAFAWRSIDDMIPGLKAAITARYQASDLVLNVEKQGPDLQGHDGDDLLVGGAGAGRLDGGAGRDVADLSGVASDQWIHVRDTGELLVAAEKYGGIGTTLVSIETVVAGAGNDTLMLRDGHGPLAEVDLGAGIDTIDASGLAFGIYLGEIRDEASALLSGRGIDDIRVAGVEKIVGTAQSDIFHAPDGGFTVEAGAGNDLIYGGDGDDLLIGGAGNDRSFASAGVDYFDGGAGIDALDFSLAPGGVVIDAMVHDRKFILDDGFGFAESIWGGQGIERIVGSAQADSFRMKATIPMWIDAGAGDDMVMGSDKGADTLIGGDGDNELHGLAGNDLLIGGVGRDILRGSLGTDTMWGGEGSDYFGFSLNDLVMDFARGDVIGLDGQDADWTLPGIQKFAGLGTAKGHLCFVDAANGDTVLRLYQDNDAAYDNTLFIRDGAVPASSYSFDDIGDWFS